MRTEIGAETTEYCRRRTVVLVTQQLGRDFHLSACFALALGNSSLCFLQTFLHLFQANTLATVVCVVKFHLYFGYKLFSHFRGLARFVSLDYASVAFTHGSLPQTLGFAFASRRHDLSHIGFFLGCFFLISACYPFSPRIHCTRIPGICFIVLPQNYFYSWQHCVRMQGPIIETCDVAASDTMQHNSWLLMP